MLIQVCGQWVNPEAVSRVYVRKSISAQSEAWHPVIEFTAGTEMLRPSFPTVDAADAEVADIAQTLHVAMWAEAQ